MSTNHSARLATASMLPHAKDLDESIAPVTTADLETAESFLLFLLCVCFLSVFHFHRLRLFCA